MRERAFPAAAVLAVLAAAPFAPLLIRGLTIFWGDLTYIHHPWRALDAQLLAEGRFPLWNPFVYLGMPLSAVMQDSLYYPGSAAFFFFGFPSALAFFEILHLWLAGVFSFLWLRSLGARASAAMGGALLYSLGGLMLENRQFPNHLAVLSLVPAALLFSRRPVLLGLTLCCSFFAGFPPFFAGTLLLVPVMSAILADRRGRTGPVRFLTGWAAACAVALALSAALLLPAAELAWHSRRAAGVGAAEALDFALAPKDLVQWLSPIFVPWRAFDPEAQWWKCDFLGLAGALACAAGLWAAGRRGTWLALWAGAAAWLALGGSTAVSRLAWERLAPLHFIRYPGNVTYLAWPALAALAAAALSRVAAKSPRWAWLWVWALAAELSFYGWGAMRAAPRGLFAWKGPLVSRLQEELAGRRYLLSPLAQQATSGVGLADWKGRLYGMTNAPFRIRSAANFGEPLVPAASYRFMESLYAASGAGQAAERFPAADILYLLAPRVEPSALLAHRGKTLWEVLVLKSAPARAYWLSEVEGQALPEGAGVLPRSVRPLASPPDAREDAFEISAPAGLGSGFAFIGEPRYPGWRIDLETPLGSGRVVGLPALLAFQKVPVPPGPWTLHFRYDPVSWRCGVTISCAAAALLAAWSLRRAAAWTE